MRIVLLENDHFQAEQIELDIRSAFAPTEVTIDRIATEYEFRRRLDEIASSQPDVVILDVMVRWAEPGPVIPEMPPEVREEGHFRAGLRCAKLLNAQAPRTPFILYSVLDKRDLSDEISALGWSNFYLTKQAQVAPLIEKMQQLIRRKGSAS